MPFKCCVYGCKSNYSSSESSHTQVFRFPTSEESRNEWIKALPNKDFIFSENKRICVHHWPQDFQFKIVKGGAKVPCNPPSIFRGVPDSCIPKTSSKRKYTSFEERNTVPDELKDFEIMEQIRYESLASRINAEFSIEMLYVCENVAKKEICIYSADRNEVIHRFSIFIRNAVEVGKFQVTCFSGIRKIYVPFLNQNTVRCWSQLQNVIQFVFNYEDVNEKSKTEFVSRQIYLLNQPSGTAYEISDLMIALNLYSRSRSMYIELRNYFKLPSIRCLQKITSKVDKLSDLEFLTTILKICDGNQKLCSIIFDEVYVRPGFQYCGGKVYGSVVNSTSSPASTILAVMVKCFMGGPKFVFKLFPVCKLDSNFQAAIVHDIIDILKKSGATPVSIIADNSKVNQRTFSMLSGELLLVCIFYSLVDQ